MPMPSTPKIEHSPDLLKGWQQVATFLGLPISTAQRWARSGMPVTREGRRVQASPEELNRWMARETAEPVHIATDSADLSSELQRGLAYAKKQVKKQQQAQNKKAA